MKKKVLLVLASMIVGSMLQASADRSKLYIQFEPGPADGQFWFVQDVETGTRCYAFRHQLDDGAAISCVPSK